MEYRDNACLNAAKAAYEGAKMSESQVAQLKETIQRAKVDNRRSTAWRKHLMGIAAAIALCIALPNISVSVAQAMAGIPVLGSVVRAVTFRNYEYEDESHSAQIQTPQLVIDGDGSGTLGASVAEINTEIAQITDELTAECKESLQSDGYSNILVSSEVVTATEEYFTLRLICYQANASGYEEVRYYTIDLKTGERLHLSNLFADGADYVTPISAEIRRQMRERMAEDESVSYWLDSEDPAWDFTAIDPDAEFYLNESGEVVVSFNEGDVAPMYMGVVTFTIPNEVIADIRK